VILVTLENFGLDIHGSVVIGSGRVVFTVQGHAPGGRKGEDVVCAGVSSLVQSCVVALARIAGVSQELEQRDGFLRSSMELEDSFDKLREAKAILGVMITGLEEIRKLQKSSIDIIYKEV
jgi:hypothetical protein